MDISATGTFELSALERELSSSSYEELISGLPIPTAIVTSAGIVSSANAAFAELLSVDASSVRTEPFLSWIARAGDREAFGREFMGLRKRPRGTGFVRELSLRASLGPATACSVRVVKLAGDRALLTCARAVAPGDPESELGRAVTRALDAVDQGVLLVDGEGRIVHANPAARSLLGESILGRGFLELAPPAAVEQFSRGLNLARAGSFHDEVDLLRPDGEPIPVDLSVAAGTGAGAPAVVLFRDLRARRRRQFDERLMAQVDRSLISSTEPREAVTAACSVLVTGLGAVRAVLVTSFGGLWERWEVRPDQGASFTSLGDAPPRAWSQQEGVVRVSAQTQGIQATFGTFGTTETGLQVALRAPGGVVGHLLVTQRQAAWTQHEAQLLGQLAPQLALGLANGLLMLETRALAAYQGRVLDQTAVLLNSVDGEGRVVTWNRASEHLLKIPAEEANGKRFGVEVAAAADPEHWSQTWETLKREGMIAREVSLTDADGRAVPLHLEGRLVREGTEIKGAVLVGLDLRQRRALEGQVLKTQKLAAVGLLAAGIAHEINNPLTGVVGYSKLLLERDLPPTVRQWVEKIQASGERCRKIVEGVLLFSRQQGGERASVDLGTAIDRVTRIGEYQWRMHNVRIIREGIDSGTVMADPDQIEQILLNLLSNAVDAMPRGGTIRIGLAEHSKGLALSVSDEGVGIPEEIRDSIFDPFFSTKEIGKGTGLGLAISYGIVRDHGGDILLESSAGRGTTFTVVLPRDGQAASESPLPTR